MNNTNFGFNRLTEPEIAEKISKYSNGNYEYVPDEKFPYKNTKSQLLVYDKKRNKYNIVSLSYICYNPKRRYGKE